MEPQGTGMSDQECLKVIEKLEQQQQGLLQAHELERRQAEDHLRAVRRRYYRGEEDIVSGDNNHFHFNHLTPLLRRKLEEGGLSAGFPGEAVLTGDRITQLMTSLDGLSAGEIHNSYRLMHAPEYLDRISRHLASIPAAKRDIFRSCKYAVCICARNETMLPSVIAALRQSYGDEFETQAAVMVYQNYTDRSAIAGEEEDAIRQINQSPNVVVVSEELPPWIKSAEVKKVAADILLGLLPDQSDTTLVFTDADLVELSEQAIQRSEIGFRQRKQNNVPFTAATTAAYPDKSLTNHFPVLAFAQMLNHHVNDELIKNKVRSPSTVGSWLVTSKRSYEACGGFIPEEMYEDMNLTTQLNLASACYLTGEHAVVDMSLEDGSEVNAFYNPNRDIEAILRGVEGSRFLRENYLLMSGSKRLDWKNLSLDGDPPRLLRREFNLDDAEYVIKSYIARNIPQADMLSWIGDNKRVQLLRTIQVAALQYGAQFNLQQIECDYYDLTTQAQVKGFLDFKTLQEHPDIVIVHVDT